MELFLEHLAKSTAIGLLFLASYVLFLRKETYFRSNRMYLLLGVLLAAILPFVQFTKTVFVDPEPIAIGDYTVIQNTQVATNDIVNWQTVVLAIYSIGVSILSIRFLVQLWRIKTIKKKGDVLLDDDIKHIRTKNRLSPFSFFKNIFYCPTQFDTEELNAIIMHEKAHAKQHHSLDVLFIQLVCIIFWFNPLAWFFKHFIKQNLEYLADAAALEQVADKKQYQYLMLRQAIGTEKMAITNPFNNSLTKKRITMLHQNQSKKLNFFKLLIILPILGLFLVAFNTKTEFKVRPNKEATVVQKDVSFEYIIQNNTSNDALQQIKAELKKENIDFSFVAVRNEKTQIIDIQLHLKGTAEENANFNMEYDSNSKSPISPIKLISKDAAVFIVTQDSKTTIEESTKADLKTNISSTKVRITNITIEVDKNSTDENLKKDSKFVEDNHNIKIDFKGIKRNSAGEITAIKVVYDNGSGDKGNYQQKKSEGISPFKIAMTFNDDGLATIDILGQEELHTHKNKTMVWVSDDDDGEREVIEIKKHGQHKNVWVSDSGKKHKIVKIEGDGDHTMIWNGMEEIGEHQDIKIVVEDGTEKYFLNGKEVEKEELEEMEFDVILNGDEKNGDVKVHVISEDHKKGKDVKKYKIRVNKDGDTLTEQVFKKVKITSDVDSNDEDNNVFIIDLDESVDHQNKVSILSDGKEPLIIIDGKESSRKEMDKMIGDTSKIESIEVLKGEGASKKYGDKAKNGVIEITTKKGN